MYLAFNSEIYFHETTPPDTTDVIWIQTCPTMRLVPTSAVLVGLTEFIPESTQTLKIYEFETVPTLRVYSEVSNTWEITNVGVRLQTSDGYMLTDMNGLLITTKG